MKKKRPPPNSALVQQVLDETVRVAQAKRALVQVCIGDDGEVAFRFSGGGEPGPILLEFYPERLAEWALLHGEECDKETHDFVSSVAPTKTYERDDEVIVFYAQLIAGAFLEAISGKAERLVNEVEKEVSVWLRAKLKTNFVSFTESQGLHVVDREKLYKELMMSLDDLAKSTGAEQKEFLKRTIGFTKKPSLGSMKSCYERLLPLWTDAKSIYRKNDEREAWQEMVEIGISPAKVPGGQKLPKDLIALLSGKESDLAKLPEPRRTATEGGEDYSKASNLALEHAARLCGLRSFQHPPRYLRALMEKKPAKPRSKVLQGDSRVTKTSSD